MPMVPVVAPDVPAAIASAYEGRLLDIVERSGGGIERAEAVDWQC
jgi:hypothetical protein